MRSHFSDSRIQGIDGHVAEDVPAPFGAEVQCHVYGRIVLQGEHKIRISVLLAYYVMLVSSYVLKPAGFEDVLVALVLEVGDASEKLRSPVANRDHIAKRFDDDSASFVFLGPLFKV